MWKLYEFLKLQSPLLIFLFNNNSVIISTETNYRINAGEVLIIFNSIILLIFLRKEECHRVNILYRQQGANIMLLLGKHL